jgi:NADH-quinone oxidoreductase subunit H
VEYSGIRFGLFFLAEFGDMFIVAALSTACFLGGWNVPFVRASALSPLWGNLLSLGVFLAKAFTMVLIMMWVRWTLPRLRVDQLMRMSWKYMVPLTFVNLLGVSVWLLLFHGKGIPQMIAALFG